MRKADRAKLCLNITCVDYETTSAVTLAFLEFYRHTEIMIKQSIKHTHWPFGLKWNNCFDNYATRKRYINTVIGTDH